MKLDSRLIWHAIQQSFYKLSPLHQLRNPVIFVTYCAAIFSTFLYFNAISFWLWTTVLFANFSESLAEAYGKAMANALRKSRHEIKAKKLKSIDQKSYTIIPATSLKPDDLVLIEAGDTVPLDGQILAGIASLDESAITGESAPVIREAGGDRGAVTRGTQVLSDWIIVQITADPGETFLDQFVLLVQSTKREKTANEIALNIFLIAMTVLFLAVMLTLLPFSTFSVDVSILLALVVCLIPTTIAGLLNAIGIAGTSRLIQANVITNSAQTIEAAGEVTTLFLDKTGTLTFGNRQAIAFHPIPEISLAQLAHAAALASIADNTPEGKSIVSLAREKYQTTPTEVDLLNATFIPFTIQTRLSGIQFNGKKILKGAPDQILILAPAPSKNEIILKIIEKISKNGSTPLLVLEDTTILGVIELKDIIKPGMKKRLAQLRAMGIKSIMITGDNPFTTAAIANEVGVDDFFAEVTPEKKLNIIKLYQKNGNTVAMMGDGTDDAPALAQTDVAVAMNSGTQAAKEAANMVDLDSDPTKLIEIVKIAKQLQITRGALITFTIAADLAIYITILPIAFLSFYPELNRLNILQLPNPDRAILSTLIFNALIMLVLMPFAFKGILRNNLMIVGLGGLLIPCIGIKLIDLLLGMLS